MQRKINTSFTRLCGAAGIGFAAMIALVNILLIPSGMPHAGAETSEVVAFFTEETDMVGISSAPAPIAWALATLFGAGLLSALWRSDRARGEAWSLVGFAGLVLQNCTFLGIIAIRHALASTTKETSDATAALWALHNAILTLNGTFLALALVGLSVSGLRAHLIHRWHAALGLLAALLLFTPAVLTPLVIDTDGPLGLLGLTGWLLWVAWLITYGITLIRLPTPTPS